MKQEDYLEIIEQNKSKHRSSLETLIQGRKLSSDNKKDSHDYLTFVALEDGAFTFTPKNNNVISYSTDNGKTWTEGNSVEVSNGDKVMWKGTMTPSSNGIGKFGASGNFDVQGNIMSLLFGDNYKGQTDLTGKNYAFYNLFSGNTKVVNAENLSLLATTLANSCYNSMFSGCTNLISTPELPATTLGRGCYYSMFYGCTSLTIAPQLPATTLARFCYDQMFMSCTSLTTAPELLATASLNNNIEEIGFIYESMFENCTNLVYGPSILPITTVDSNSYNRMFMNCVNLERAPEILATNIAYSSYTEMFSGCSKVNRIKHMLLSYPANPTYQPGLWVNGVSATGTFIKNASMTNEWSVGVNGIPTGWTVETASE